MQSIKRARTTTAVAYRPRRRTRFTKKKGGGRYNKFQDIANKGIEKKFYDIDFNDIEVTNSTGMLSYVCIPSAGDNGDNRTGREILITSVHIQGAVYQKSAATAQKCRLFLCYDRQSNGAYPALADIFNSNATYYVNAHINMNNKNRFLVLADRFFEMNSTASGQNGQNVDMYVKCALKANFNSASGSNIIYVASGGIFLLIMVENPTGTSAALFRGDCRTRFLDN